MMDQTEYQQRIREAAYRLWAEAGRPEGQADEFWRQARAQVFAQEVTHEATQGSDDASQDKTLADSFPASDPPSHSVISGAAGALKDLGGRRAVFTANSQSAARVGAVIGELVRRQAEADIDGVGRGAFLPGDRER